MVHTMTILVMNLPPTVLNLDKFNDTCDSLAHTVSDLSASTTTGLFVLLFLISLLFSHALSPFLSLAYTHTHTLPVDYVLVLRAPRGMEGDKYWEVSYCLERVVPNTRGEEAIN